MTRPPKPTPPRPYLMREDSTRICGYLNDDGTVEWVPNPSRIGRVYEVTFGWFTWPAIVVVLVALLWAAAARADVLWVKFAPEDDCTAAIVAEFDRAKSSIDYQLYNATSQPVGDALIRAHKRGVKVTVILDSKANAPPKPGKKSFSQAKRLKQAGVPVYLDRSHPIAHNKVRIIDGKLLISGSFNDSKAANRNAENLYAEDDPAVVKRFAENFKRHLAHAEAY